MASKIILYFTTVIFIFVSIYSIIEICLRKFSKKKCVHYHDLYIKISFPSTVLFLALDWIAYFQDGSLLCSIVFSLIAFVAMSLMILWSNCKITYDESGFTHKNYFGFNKRFTYEQVTAWYDDDSELFVSSLCVADKKIYFSLDCDEVDEFCQLIRSCYEQTHNNEHIPTIRKARGERDTKKRKNNLRGFRNNVPNAKDYPVVILLIAVPLIICLVFSIIDSYKNVDISDLDGYKVNFYDYYVDGQDLYLVSSKEEIPFCIIEYKHHLNNSDDLFLKINGQTEFNLTAKHCSSGKYGPGYSYYRVYTISSGNVFYRNVEDINKLNQRLSNSYIAAFGGFLIILIIFSIIMYLVGRFPHKFPEWLFVGLFVRRRRRRNRRKRRRR